MRSAVLAAAALVAVLRFAAPALAAGWNEIEGTANADYIRGTDAPDRIHGLDGNDVVRGRCGDDRLVGGLGYDVLDGGPGQDTFLCRNGRDVVIVDSSRHPERIGDGCEAVIFEVPTQSHRCVMRSQRGSVLFMSCWDTSWHSSRSDSSSWPSCARILRTSSSSSSKTDCLRVL
jgi:hypothetical protein